MALSPARSTLGYFAGAALAALMAAGPAAAQDAADMNSAIEKCRQAPTDATRIACLERAIEQMEGPGGIRPSQQAASADGIGAEDLNRGGGDGGGGILSRIPGMGLFGGDDDDGQAVATRSGEASVSGIGSEQVERRNQTRQSVERQLQRAGGLRVARYDTVPFRRLVVYLDNGQVWRQIQGDSQEIRVNLDRNQTVSITESRISGYKMSLNEMNRTIRVERIR